MIVLLVVVYSMTNLLLLYVCFTLPMTPVVILNRMYVQPLSSIKCSVGETFLNLYPSNYGVYVCQAFRPQRVVCWHGDVGKTLVIQGGAYSGAHFTVTAGQMFKYTVDPEFIPMVNGEPRLWVKQLIHDLKIITKASNGSPLLAEQRTMLADLLTNMNVETLLEKEEEEESLVVTTTGRRHLRVKDIEELDKLWLDIKRAMQMVYDMTGTQPISPTLV